MDGFGLALGVGALVWAAFALDLFGFLARDELVLRLLMLAAMMLYMAYYALVADAPLWDAILTNGALAVVNAAMILVVIAERTTLFMSRADHALYGQFRPLSPGQFRRLLRLGARRRPEAGERLLGEGEASRRLFFLSAGEAAIEKGGREARIVAPAFLGEIAFLRGSPATATVRALGEAEIIEWQSDALSGALERSPAFRNALVARLNEDLLDKVARGIPAGAPG